MEDEDHIHEQIFARFSVLLEQSDAAAPTPPLEIEPTPALINWSHSLLSSLSDLKRRREARIQSMYDQLEALWRRMGIDDADMDGFVEANRGSTEDTERMYEEELERMLELKREKMSSFVGSARQEIEKLWDEMMVGEDERKEFASFYDGMCFAYLVLGSIVVFINSDLQTSILKNCSSCTRRRSSV